MASTGAVGFCETAIDKGLAKRYFAAPAVELEQGATPAKSTPSNLHDLRNVNFKSRSTARVHYTIWGRPLHVHRGPRRFEESSHSQMSAMKLSKKPIHQMPKTDLFLFLRKRNKRKLFSQVATPIGPFSSWKWAACACAAVTTFSSHPPIPFSTRHTLRRSSLYTVYYSLLRPPSSSGTVGRLTVEETRGAVHRQFGQQ
jgi:hypothetical protein